MTKLVKLIIKMLEISPLVTACIVIHEIPDKINEVDKVGRLPHLSIKYLLMM